MCNQISLPAARAPRRRRADPRPHRAPDHRGGGRAGAERAADDPRARRRRRHLHGGPAEGGDPRPGQPLPAALARRVRRADHEHGRRTRMAARPGEGGARGGARARAARAHGRRAADERGRRLAHERRRVRAAASTPPGSTSRRASAHPSAPCSPARASSWTRPGAGSSRWAARSGSRASSRRAASTRSTTTSSASPRTTRTRACSRTGLRSSAWTSSPPETNIVIFSAPEGFVERMARHAGRASGTPDGRVRAVTHLDVSRDDIDSALQAARDSLLP